MATYQPAKTGYYAYIKQLRAMYPDASLPMLQQLASMGDYAKQHGVSSDMYETPNQMLEDLQAKRQNEAEAAGQRQAPQREAPPVPRQSPRQSGGGENMFGPYQQYAIGRGMAGDAMGAISNELDSRVAQQREARRMQHQAGMSQYEMEMQYKMLLARLQHEREMAERDMMMKREAADKQRGILYSSDWYKPAKR